MMGYIIDGVMLFEEVIVWEVGGKFDLVGGIIGMFVLFNIDKKNVLVLQYNDVMKLIDWCMLGKVCLCGVEFDVFGKFGECVNVIVSYVYIDVKMIEDLLYVGNQLWNVVCYIVLFVVVYDFGMVVGGDDLCFGVDVCYVGVCFGDLVNSFMLLLYVFVDVFVIYDMWIGKQKLLFQFNVKNLFNCMYYLLSVNCYFVVVGDVCQVVLLIMLQF